jgi:hypothetical protein
LPNEWGNIRFDDPDKSFLLLTKENMIFFWKIGKKNNSNILSELNMFLYVNFFYRINKENLEIASKL